MCMIWNGRRHGCSSNFGHAKFGVRVVEDDTTKLTTSLSKIDGDLDTFEQKNTSTLSHMALSGFVFESFSTTAWHLKISLPPPNTRRAITR